MTIKFSSFRVAPSVMMFGCVPRSTSHLYSNARSCDTSPPALSWFPEQTATGTMSASSLMRLGNFACLFPRGLDLEHVEQITGNTDEVIIWRVSYEPPKPVNAEVKIGG